LWNGFAKFYESYEEIENANVVYHKATMQEFKSIEELAHLYCAWAEMHIRHNNIQSAIEIMRHGVSNKQPKQNLVNNIRAWSLYIDLLQSCDELEDAARAYDYVIDRKIATPLMILNYVSMLQ